MREVRVEMNTHPMEWMARPVLQGKLSGGTLEGPDIKLAADFFNKCMSLIEKEQRQTWKNPHV